MKIYQLETGDLIDLAKIDAISSIAEPILDENRSFYIILNGHNLLICIENNQEYIRTNLINAWIQHKQELEEIPVY